MTNFVQFLLLEGGNAVAVASRINQKNVQATLESIYKLVLPNFKIKKTDTDKFSILGSAGKKKDDDSSGDLDIAISIEHVQKTFKLKTIEDTIKKIQEIVVDLAKEIHKDNAHDGQDIKDFFKLMPGLMTFSIGFPIVNTDGKQDGLFVQLDIMPSENIDLIGWSMSAPHYSESNYKAVVRNQLLSSIIKYCEMKIIKKDDQGEPAITKRYYYDLKNGLYYVTQERSVGKNGKYKKDSKITEKKLITSNKDKIIQFLFGNKYSAKDATTFEGLWKLFNSNDFKFKEKYEEIKNHFLDAMEKEGIKIPKD